ncbi:N-acetylneuraminate synthase family protein [Candidatus Nitrosopelagicus sp.]|nr:N-acetylneuraminate synthase family protein [Candidatus Nitrosopelagicus sp.]
MRNLKIKPIKIKNKVIGEGRPCYIIAEIGSNFNGDINLAKKLIKKAKESGADAAKFQSFETEKILSKKGFEKKVSFQSKWKNSVWNIYKNAELPIEWIEKLEKYAKKCKIQFLSAPYHIEAVDELVRNNVPLIKVGSGEITNIEFLKYVARKKLPVLLAAGASTLKDVNLAVKAIRSQKNNKIILMQATTQYPSPIKDTNLKVMQEFSRLFQVNVGYSDHTPGYTAILGSVALGACVIEKHFTLDTKSAGPDHPHSLNPEQFKQMVEKIREMEIALGHEEKIIEDSEKNTKIIQRRGIWTIKNIKKGEKFSKINIDVLRPCNGIPASDFIKLLNKKAKRNYQAFTALKNKDL